MGERVNQAQNEVKKVQATPEAIFCPNCGNPDDSVMTRVDDEGNDYETHIGPTGYAPADYAEGHWIEVDGWLCCSIYCAAKVRGASEEQAQLARGLKTRLDMRADGREEEADADEAYVKDMLENPEQYPLVAQLDEIADEDTHEKVLARVEGESSTSDIDEEFSQLMEDLKTEEGGDN